MCDEFARLKNNGILQLDLVGKMLHLWEIMDPADRVHEVSTTVVTASGRAFLPDLGPAPDVETLHALARKLEMFVGFELSTHVKWLGLDPSPVYNPQKRARLCIGLCRTHQDVPILAQSSFDVINPEQE